MYNMKKSLLAMMLALLVVVTGVLPAYAEDLPYDTYNYDYWEDISRTPAAYKPQGSVLGSDLVWEGKSLGALSSPEDLFVAPNGDVYVADTKNHRIIVLDNDLKTVLNVITCFENAGFDDYFNEPKGIAVTEDGTLYVADNANHRIVVLNADGTLNRIVEIPSQSAEVKIERKKRIPDASVKTVRDVTYTVSTYVEGMGAMEDQAKAGDGTTYVAVNVPEGSASSVKNGDLTYTVTAVEAGLRPLQNEAIVDAEVTGTVTDEVCEGSIGDFLVIRDGKAQLVSGVAFSLADPSGKVLAATQVAPEKAVARVSTSGDSVVLLDAKGAKLAELKADGTIVRYDAAGAVSESLTNNAEAFVLKNAEDKSVAELKADGGAVFYDAAGALLATLANGEEGLTLTDAGKNDIVLSAVEESAELKNARKRKAAVLTKTEEGFVLADTKDVPLAVIGLDGSISIRNAEGGDAVVKAADGSISVKDAAGQMIAAVSAAGDVTLAGADGVNVVRIAADQTLTLLDAQGGDAATLVKAEDGMTVREASGAQTKLLQLQAASETDPTLVLPLVTLLKLVSENSRITALQPDGSEIVVRMVKGSYAWVVPQAGNAVERYEMGAVSSIAAYDPDPQKDLFLMVGRLIKGPKSEKLSGIKGVWVDEEGYVYAAGEKGAVKLSSSGILQDKFDSYWNEEESTKVIQFTKVTEFSVVDGTMCFRDDANKVVQLDAVGELVQVVASNAVRVTDAAGEEIAVLTSYGDREYKDITGVKIIGSMLLIGQKDGTVVITDLNGNFIEQVRNDSVLALDGEGKIQRRLTSAIVEDAVEEFTGLTGVTMLEDKLCVAGENNRVLVLDVQAEQPEAVHVAQNNCVKASDGKTVATVAGYELDGKWVAFDDINGVEGVALNDVMITEFSEDKKKNKDTGETTIEIKAERLPKNQLCVADSNDNLIVMNDKLETIRVVCDPDTEVLDTSKNPFTPLKVSVDYAGRIYCVGKDMFEGLMVFETDGEFTGFFGTIPVTLSAWDKFWRKLATKEERSKQILYIPTEFTGIDIDSEGFVYATNADTAGLQAVRRLNPKGEDVIRMGANANLGGDIAINGVGSEYAGVSRIVDVVYREKGIYSLLDAKRSRIFTYDHEGNLLYIFGGKGSQSGTLTMPVAIEYAQDRLLVLDSSQGSILIFGETDYGRLINEAVGLRFDGDESLAVDIWKQVLEMDENNELANTGIGKAYLSAGDNKMAMEYLKRGMNREYYSVAFKRYRNELLKDNIQYILTGAVVLAAALTVYFKVVKPKIKSKREGGV